MGAALNRFPSPRRLLAQWVPHGYGYRSMNVFFCLWLWGRSVLRRDEIDLMIHEPFLSFREGSLKQDLAALVHRAMIAILLHSTRRVWVSTLSWIAAIKPYTLGRNVSFNWLPVPSNIPLVRDHFRVGQIRGCFDPGALLFGHFGTFGRPITDLLRDMTVRLLHEIPNARMLLIGPGSDHFRSRLIWDHPGIADRLVATGSLASDEVSLHISACDVMIQPYPDGVTTRRGTAMATMCHGRPTITTIGRLTEQLWRESDTLALHAVGDLDHFMELATRLSNDETERARLGKRALTLYAEKFDISYTIAALCAEKPSVVAAVAR
jgi:hypothetical protein